MLYNPTNLRNLMIENNISALKLGEIIGMHRQTIGKHLMGRAEWKGSSLMKLADYFDVSTDYLLGRTKFPH